MKKLLNILFYPVTILFMLLIYLYKILISPLIPKSCIYTPTCSTYAITALKRFGLFEGVFLATKRVLSCNSFSKGGWDPVPDNIKGDMKWVL